MQTETYSTKNVVPASRESLDTIHNNMNLANDSMIYRTPRLDTSDCFNASRSANLNESIADGRYDQRRDSSLFKDE